MLAEVLLCYQRQLQIFNYPGNQRKYRIAPRYLIVPYAWRNSIQILLQFETSASQSFLLCLHHALTRFAVNASLTCSYRGPQDRSNLFPNGSNVRCANRKLHSTLLICLWTLLHASASGSVLPRVQWKQSLRICLCVCMCINNRPRPNPQLRFGQIQDFLARFWILTSRCGISRANSSVPDHSTLPTKPGSILLPSN